MPRPVRYRVLRKIAHGGMAEIFLAVQVGAEGFEKPVVLKRILPALAADPHFVRMLVDEAHIASSLNHSNLVQVLDLGKSGDQFFLVLEFVDGWSLEQVRRRAQKVRVKLPLPLILYMVASLCRALGYVHRHARDGKALSIVHRDVSPQNVLIGREGDVKLADFGIAKASGRREKSVAGIIKGKFAYMSPEQSLGGELDARSDLFSVGTLLYILTTGKKPFDGPTDLEVLMRVRRARYDKPSDLVRDFNPDVERVIARALKAERSRRWQSADQMADRVDTILAKLGQPSGPAVLKRWLDSLTARDGVLPPGDVRVVVAEAGAGTIELETDDLELAVGGSSELRPPEAQGGLTHVDADADAAVAAAEVAHALGGPAPTPAPIRAVPEAPPTVVVPTATPVLPAPVPEPEPALAVPTRVAGVLAPGTAIPTRMVAAPTRVVPLFASYPSRVASVADAAAFADDYSRAALPLMPMPTPDAETIVPLEEHELPLLRAEPPPAAPAHADEEAPAGPPPVAAADVEATRAEDARANGMAPTPGEASAVDEDLAALTYINPPGPDPSDVVPEAWAPAEEPPAAERRGRAGRFARAVLRATAGLALLLTFAGGGAYLARSHFPPWLVMRVVAPFDAWLGGWVKRVHVLLERDESPAPPAVSGDGTR